MRLLAGTSGYSYKEWRGNFYPEKLPAARMLEHYAGSLPAVEINNTFYRMPSKEMLARWREQVPGSFRFAIKASQRISHTKRLKGAEDETAYLLDTLEALGDRLGVILFQMPPFFKKDAAALSGFLDLLPESVPCAFEFRHPSWFDSEIFDALKDCNKTLCIADETNARFDEVVQTADVGYVRLRRALYDERALSAWAKALLARDWSHCYVFFKHEDEAGGPALARTFLDIAARMGDGGIEN